MKSIPHKIRFSLAAWLGVLLLGGALAPNAAVAQGSTETKIRLMADALRARDDGNLETARRNLTELAELAPSDPSVQRLLNEVETALARERAASTVPAAAPVRQVVTPPAPTPMPTPAPATNPAPGAFARSDRTAREPDPMLEPVVDLAAMEAEIAALAAAEEERQRDLVQRARSDLGQARDQASRRRFDAALATLDTAMASLPANPSTQPLIAELAAERTDLRLEQARYQFEQGDNDGARQSLAAYAAGGGAGRAADRLRQRLNEVAAAPLPQVQASPPTVRVDYAAVPSAETELWARARAEYASDRLNDAATTLDELLAVAPGHGGARRLALRIAEEQADMALRIRDRTRAQLIEEVGLSWQRPGVLTPRSGDGTAGPDGSNPLMQKLSDIQVPSISFSSVELQKVVATLSDLSRELDADTEGVGGVNILVIDPQDRRPNVSLTLRNLSLKRVLDFITDSVGYQYEVQADAVVVRPGGETSTLDTEFFPITRSTVIRMTGIGGGLASGGAPASNDPFSPAPAPGAATPGGGSEAQALRAFLQQAGVDFDSTGGSSLAYDGSAMIVTQTTRNIDRIRNILNRYNDVRQVEIEAKFMEVQEGALDELGVNWGITRRGVAQYDPSTGAPILGADGRQVFVPQEAYRSDNRSLGQAFAGSVRSSNIIIDGEPVASLAPPLIPGQAPLGSAAGALADITGTVGEFDVNAVIRALSQMSGTDLLSAPRVTVLSGNPANITVAQELRFPLSYGEIRSEVGRGGSSNSDGLSGGGVAITSGTPQDFTTRNVGVELRVTPTVEEDDYSISLDLAPKVTEFEGFIEYGGPSVAITGNRTVTVPPAFYQPIFSVRELSTKVTIWDGATLVMGGLTREEVKTVHDKIPILGDIPILGRAFRSTSESSQKRNLLIFVTANLVSPGGSPKKQTVDRLPPSSLFQNPTLVTPGGPATRE